MPDLFHNVVIYGNVFPLGTIHSIPRTFSQSTCRHSTLRFLSFSCHQCKLTLRSVPPSHHEPPLNLFSSSSSSTFVDIRAMYMRVWPRRTEQQNRRYPIQIGCHFLDSCREFNWGGAPNLGQENPGIAPGKRCVLRREGLCCRGDSGDRVHSRVAGCVRVSDEPLPRREPVGEFSV